MRVVIGETYEGAVVASLLVAQRYEIRGATALALVDDDAAIADEAVYYPREGPPGPSLLRCDSLAYPFRSMTDLVVQGTARSPHPVTELPVRLYCAGRDFVIDHTLIATGDRVVEVGRDRSARLSSPTPFTEMPLRYDRAFGGTDALAEVTLVDPALRKALDGAIDDPQERAESGALSYPRNPAGRGHLLVEASVGGAPWPNLEWADQRVEVGSLDDLLWPFERWVDRPSPAAFDWLPHGWFPRAEYFGCGPLDDDAPVPDFEQALGLFPEALRRAPRLERMHPYGYQGAHPRLWRQRLRGDERLYVSALSPDGGALDVRLPGLRPEVALRVGAGGFRAAESSLDVVFVEADEARVTLLWRASCAVDDGEAGDDLAAQVEPRVAWRRDGG